MSFYSKSWLISWVEISHSTHSKLGAWKGSLPLRIAMLNPGRRPWRSFTTSLSFGFVIFLMISLSISSAVIETEAGRTGHVGGGYEPTPEE